MAGVSVKRNGHPHHRNQKNPVKNGKQKNLPCGPRTSFLQHCFPPSFHDRLGNALYPLFAASTASFQPLRGLHAGNAAAFQRPVHGTAATFRSPDPDAPELLIDAHADEVGVVIAGITPSGFLKVRPVGFPDFQSMLSCPYRFDGEHGPVIAFAGAVPGWWLNREPLPAGGEYILFDAGASSAEEAREMGLSVGRRGVPSTKPELLHGTRLMAHGLDCRLNSFMLMELASFLSRHKKDLKYHVTLLSSSQEETGLAGATAYCGRNRPKLAIVIDCTLDTVQLDDLPPREENERLSRQAMGEGPVIFTHDKIFYQPITAQLLQLAEEHGIPFQKDAAFPPGMANFVPVKLYGGHAAFLGPPIRYMHSPRELADLKDVKATLDLLGRFLCTPPSAEVKTASVQKKEHP